MANARFINGVEVTDYVGFLYDGCHKLYLFKEEQREAVENHLAGWEKDTADAYAAMTAEQRAAQDRRDAKKTKYDKAGIHPIDELPAFYVRACDMRFIDTFEPVTSVVAQCTEEVNFVGFDTDDIETGLYGDTDLYVTVYDCGDIKIAYNTHEWPEDDDDECDCEDEEEVEYAEA